MHAEQSRNVLRIVVIMGNVIKPCHTDAAKFRGIKFVFLDRDGVLIRKLPEGKYVTSWSETELLPGVAKALAMLNTTRKTVIVVTNQRGIGLKLLTEGQLDNLHHRLRTELALLALTLTRSTTAHTIRRRKGANAASPLRGSSNKRSGTSQEPVAPLA